MPSPFPGMDPYLEDPGLWPDVHHELISEARAFLNKQLAPKYYVRVEERVYISKEDDPGRSVIIPDLRIGKQPGYSESGPLPLAEAGVQVAEPETLVTLLDEEIHEPRLEIIDREDHGVVTVIEVVSPTNKVGGSEGRRSYQQKRIGIFDSPSHWVEIDLLRTGSPIVPRLARPYDYIVHLSRADERPRGWVWRIFLPQRLPIVGVPLKAGDPDVPLDLQQVLETTYDRARYDVTINYRNPPRIALSEEQAAWANEVLRSKGLR